MDKTSVDTFIQFEDEHNLFERHINDFYYWHYIRYDIFKNVFWREALSNVQKGDAPRFKDFITMLYCAIFRNTWFVHKHVDILAIGYPRKIKNTDGTREDPYIELIVRNTSHSALTLEVYSRQSNNIDSDPHQVKFIEDARLRGKIINKFLSAKEKLVLGEEAEYIFKLFSVFGSPMNKEAVLHSIQSAYSSRKVFMHKFRRLLKKTSPCCIIAAPGYTAHAMALFELALEQNIPTAEVEHGFFTELTPPQNYYRKRQIRSYPQYFFANSKYKLDNIRFPIGEDHIKLVGSPYLEKCVADRKSQTVKGEILLIDDNKYSDILLDFADRLLNYLSENGMQNYHVTLKAHPANKCDGPLWEKIKNKSGISCIIGTAGPNVYDCLEQAEVVVGVSTSTLFEAQAYGCCVCVINCDGSSNMQTFVRQGYGFYVTKPEDIFAVKDSTAHKQLWHPNALECTLSELDKVIEHGKFEVGI